MGNQQSHDEAAVHLKHCEETLSARQRDSQQICNKKRESLQHAETRGDLRRVSMLRVEIDRQEDLKKRIQSMRNLLTMWMCGTNQTHRFVDARMALKLRYMAPDAGIAQLESELAKILEDIGHRR